MTEHEPLEPKQKRYNLRSAASASKRALAENGSPEPKRMRYYLRSSVSASENASNLVPVMPVNLMRLDNDCLLNIMDLLTLNDLPNLAYVNKRLNSLTKYYFQLRYKLQFNKDCGLMIGGGKKINLSDLRGFLQTFGSEIAKLKLSRNSFDNTFDDFKSMEQILRFINNYCKLKELTLIGFGTGAFNQKFFQELTALTLERCSVTREWIPMAELKALKLSQVIFRRWPLKWSGYREYGDPPSAPISFPFHRFGRLEEVQISDVNLPNEALVKLTHTNMAIKRLSIAKCFQITDHIFYSVAKLKNLQEFEFLTDKNGSRYKWDPLLCLKKLKALKLTCQSTSFLLLLDGLIKNGTAIKHLELGTGTICDRTVECISQLKTVEVLKFNQLIGINESHVLNIAKGLNQLHELWLCIKKRDAISQNGLVEIVNAASRLKYLKIDAPGITLGLDTYQALMTAVKERKEQIQLELTSYVDGEQSGLPNGITDQNEKSSEWIVVKELNRESNHMFDGLQSTVGNPPPRPRSRPRRYYYSSDSDDDDYW